MAFLRWWSQNSKKKSAPCAATPRRGAKAKANGTLAAPPCAGCAAGMAAPSRAGSPSCHSDFYETCLSYPVYAFESVRLLLFRENEYRERRVLFDSGNYNRRRCSEGSNVDHSQAQYSPYRHRQSDETHCDDRLKRELLDQDTVKLLGEMIFGTVSMSVKVDTFKVHQFRSPQRLMLSKIFPCIQPELPKAGAIGSVFNSIRDGIELFESDSDSPSSTMNSTEMCNFRNSCKSIPLEVPDKLYRSPKICSPSLPGHSSAPYSYRSGSDVPIAVGNTPLSSSLKRFNLNQAMNFTCRMGRRLEDSSGERSDSPLLSVSRLSRLQLGFCVLFNVEEDRTECVDNEWFKRFLLLHMQIVEIELNRLQQAILKAYFSKKVFIVNVWKAWKAFIGAIKLLYETPRLARPAWLMQMQPDRDSERRCFEGTFLRVFAEVADACDVRESRFFFSTLLTACLMNHLTWVSSVAPPLRFKGDVPKLKRLPQWRRNIEGAAHPYNPHLAQLLDIWGAVTSPCRIAHTLVLGSKRDLVMKILFILSHFIRCSALEQKPRVKGEWAIRPSLKSVLESSQVISVPLQKSAKGGGGGVGGSGIGEKKKTDTVSLNRTKGSNRVVRCYSLSQAVSNEQRARHCSEKDQTRPECTGASRVRCRSGSSLSTERLMRMNAASFKLPSKFNSGMQRPHSSLHSLKNSQILYAAALDQDMPTVVCGKQYGRDAATNTVPSYQSLRINVIEEDSLKDSLLSSNEQLDGRILPRSSWSQSFSQHTVASVEPQSDSPPRITFTDVFGNSSVEKLIETECSSGQVAERSDCFAQNLGSSLMAAYTEELSPYFSLAGTSFRPDIYSKVHDMMKQLAGATIQSPEPIKEAVCVVANTCDWTVRLISSSTVHSSLDDASCLVPSKLVSDMVEQTKCLAEMKLAGELCMTALEDRLAEVYSKSSALTTLVDENQSNTLDVMKMVSLLGCDLSDIPLLMSVATVHSSDTVISLGVI